MQLPPLLQIPQHLFLGQSIRPAPVRTTRSHPQPLHPPLVQITLEHGFHVRGFDFAENLCRVHILLPFEHFSEIRAFNPTREVLVFFVFILGTIGTQNVSERGTREGLREIYSVMIAGNSTSSGLGYNGLSAGVFDFDLYFPDLLVAGVLNCADGAAGPGRGSLRGLSV